MPTTGHALRAEPAKGCLVKNRVSKAWSALHDFCPDLQSGEVDASCKFELTDSIENRVVYDGHRL